MTQTTKFNFWAFFGKLALLITFLWTSRQIYISFVSEDYNFTAVGNHSKYRVPKNQMDIIKNFEKVLLLDLAYREEINSKGLSINKLLDYSEKTENEDFLNGYNYHKSYTKILEIPEYNTTWEFQIDNIGEKPLEELILETQYEGFYKISRKNEDNIYGKFKNNIELGKLNPGYSTGIRIWVNESFDIDIYDEEKTRITHKYGYKEISYPIKVSGFLKWLGGYDYLNLIILIGILIFLYYITFWLGVSYYPKHSEIEKNRKIEELKKLEETRKLMNEKEDESEKESEQKKESE